jgi:hypothetical protein
MRLIQNLTISWEMNFYEIKELYEIEINNGKHYIKTRSSDYNLYQIREWLQNCLNSTEECEGQFSLSKVLQNADVLNKMSIKDEEKTVKNRTEESKSPSSSHMKNYLPVPEYKDFIGRDTQDSILASILGKT